MKKTVVLFFFLVFLCSASVNVFAETGYVAIKNALYNTLGFGVSGKLDELSDKNTVRIVINLNTNILGIYGLNSDNEPERVTWFLNDINESLGWFAALCQAWDVQTEYLSDGFGLRIDVYVDEIEFSVDTAEKAETAIEDFFAALDAPTDNNTPSHLIDKASTAYSKLGLRSVSEIMHFAYDDKAVVIEGTGIDESYSWMPESGDIFLFRVQTSKSVFAFVSPQNEVVATYELDLDDKNTDTGISALKERQFYLMLSIWASYIGNPNYKYELNKWHCLTDEQVAEVRKN